MSSSLQPESDGIPMSLLEMEDFHLILSESARSTPRSGYNGVSSSEVFTSSTKNVGKRPQSAKSTPKSPAKRGIPTAVSSIPLPVRSSGISLCRSRCSSATVTNKHTLEIQFINKNKRYIQMRKELMEKQKPVVDLYQNLLKIKKRLEELGKSVKLEDVKLVPYSTYKKTGEGEGEAIPAKVITEMRQSIEDIPKSLMEICKNLLSRRALIVELLESVTKAEVDVSDVSDRIDSLKNEGNQLQQSLDAIIDEYQGKIEDLVCNWQSLLSVKQSSEKVKELESKLKEQERLTQESNQVISELKKKIEDKRSVYDKSVAELNGIIYTLKDQIKKLEQDLDNERKSSIEFKSRNTTNSHNVKSMRAKIAELENEKKNSDNVMAEMQKKIRQFQEQLKHKEATWSKEREEMGKLLKQQSSTLNKLNIDKTQFETTLEAMEEQKLSTEEELQNTIDALTEELDNTKKQLEEVTSQRDEAVGKCEAFEGYVTRMGLEDKEAMNKFTSSIEWGNALRSSTTPEEEYYLQNIAKDMKIQELEDKIRQLEADRVYQIEERTKLEEMKNFEPTETEKQVNKHQECISRYRMLLEESENKLREKSAEATNLRAEIRQLKVRQDALEEQSYSCPTEELKGMVEEGRQKLSELMKKSIDNEQKLEHYANQIEKQTQQMSEMENLLRYRENMAGVLKASRDELVLEKESLTRYSQEMRTVLAEVAKEGKMKDRLIKELQEKMDLRERQIGKLEKEVRDLEANLMITNEKRFKLQEAICTMEKELQSTKAHVNQLADINSRNHVRPKGLTNFFK